MMKKTILSCSMDDLIDGEAADDEEDEEEEEEEEEEVKPVCFIETQTGEQRRQRKQEACYRRQPAEEKESICGSRPTENTTPAEGKQSTRERKENPQNSGESLRNRRRS
uniref:Uncharacterized protein n=1 Tax=Ciona savignyi TaxID=51511 RepID=H2ZNA1_CIOSA